MFKGIYRLLFVVALALSGTLALTAASPSYAEKPSQEALRVLSVKTGISFEVLQAYFSLSNRVGRFGPEWTFTNDELVEIGREITVVWNDPNATPDQRAALNERENAIRKRILESWKASIGSSCRVCRLEAVTPEKLERLDNVRVSFGNQWILIGQDPWVFETTGSPFSGDELLANGKTLNSVLFQGAKAAGLKPHWRVGGGHRHVEDSSFFNGDLRVYVNFYMFFANNPEMFMGPLALDFTNSPPFALMAEDQKDALVAVLREVDAGRITTIPEFKAAIKERVYTKTFYYTRNQEMRPYKHHAFNVAHDVTSEIRGLRPQVDMTQEFAIDTLLLAIRNYAAEYSGRIPYIRKNYRDKVEVTMERGMQTYTLKTSPAGIRAEYHKMLKLLRLDTSYFRNLSAEDFDKQLKKEADLIGCIQRAT